MREQCHYAPTGSSLICGKNIKLLFVECRFCNGFFCTFHGLAESHGCGDLAREDARNKAFLEHKNAQYGSEKRIDEHFLKEKARAKLLEAQAKRQPKQKKKKK